MIKRKDFKKFCPETYKRLKDLAHSTKDIAISLGEHYVKLTAVNPNAPTEFLYAKLPYNPNLEDQIMQRVHDIRQKLWTLYYPHFLGFAPVIQSELSEIVTKFDCGTVVTVEIKNGNKEFFDYNIDDYERFVDLIGELLVSAKATLVIPEDEQPCKDKSHCCNCGNHDCRNAPSQIQTIWQGMSESEQKAFLASLDPETLKQVQYHIDLAKKPNA